jgi:sugar/nucleoside kinase (ribokinase family)
VTPDVVVVGAATRDVDAGAPGGWRAGGAVSYGALLLARLGLRVAALVGLDEASMDAGEPVELRAAGVEVVTAPLERGPVFENVETPAGRTQTCHQLSDPLPASALPAGWRAAAAFLLVPVAGEIGPEWATVPGPDAPVGLGWQGLLRDLMAGRPVRHLAPRRGPVQARADITVLSREDLPPRGTGTRGEGGDAGDAIPDLLGRAGSGLALTAGRDGGVYLHGAAGGRLEARRWPAVPARREVDPTGAGDVFLAALLAARLLLGPGRGDGGRDLRFAATAASLSVEAPGLAGVPDLAAIQRRLDEIRTD